MKNLRKTFYKLSKIDFRRNSRIFTHSVDESKFSQIFCQKMFKFYKKIFQKCQNFRKFFPNFGKYIPGKKYAFACFLSPNNKAKISIKKA